MLPTGDSVKTGFAMSLAMLQGLSQCAIVNPRSSLVQKSRTDGVMTALLQDPSHILFIDSDQTFPPDALYRLLSHNKKVVGAASVRRDGSGVYTAKDAKGNQVDFKQRKGLHKVHTNGLCFCLVKAEVFQGMNPEDWFPVSYKDDKWIGEDESFCLNSKQNIWVDADIKLGHIGEKVYE